MLWQVLRTVERHLSTRRVGVSLELVGASAQLAMIVGLELGGFNQNSMCARGFSEVTANRTESEAHQTGKKLVRPELASLIVNQFPNLSCVL